MEKRKGLRQRILTAETVGAIEALLMEGTAFKFASEKTRRSWKNAASRRKAELVKA